MSFLQTVSELSALGKFDLIMADPPWQFRLRSFKGITAKSAAGHYRVLPLELICELPVASLAARDCLLWLWTTNPHLPEALKVMSAWGFEFKTAGTWVKRTKHGHVAMGTGYTLRSANEPFLIGTRGAPKTTRSVRSAITSGDTEPLTLSSITLESVAREHSRKPDEAFIAAEMLMPSARRVELFSRQKRVGWTSWGDEIDKFPKPEEMP